MRNKVSYTMCSGCGVCVALCPCKALRLRISVEGYLRPVFDRSFCNDCGLCVKVCPFVHHRDNEEIERSPSFINRIIGNHLKVGLAWSTQRVRPIELVKLRKEPL